MTRIIVTYYRNQERIIPKVMYYYEAFMKELQNLGNQVLSVNTGLFNEYESNVVHNKKLDSILLRRAIDFNPDLIITFNHRIPQCYLDYFDVPIVIWDGDSPLFLCDHDEIKKNIDRYKIFSISKDWYTDYKKMGMENKNYAFMPNATSVYKQDIPQNMNISYVGMRIWTNQTVPWYMSKYYKFMPQAKSIVEDNLKNGNADSGQLLKKYFAQEEMINNWEERFVYPLLEKRWLALSSVMDMGLTICGGNSRWEDVYSTMPQLLAMYNPRSVWTLDEVSEFYNSSKISLSPIHPQANGKAFPWRAFDVMASNACLVIEHSTELKELIGSDVDIPMYKSPYDVRKICKDLLENPKRRNEIVEQSQNWIEKNARWVDRFKDAEQVLGIKLFNDNEKGSVTHMFNELVVEDFDNKKKYRVSCIDTKVVLRNTSKRKKSLKKPKYSLDNLFKFTKWIAFIGVIVAVTKLLLVTEFETSRNYWWIDYIMAVLLFVVCMLCISSVIKPIIFLLKRLRRKKQKDV